MEPALARLFVLIYYIDDLKETKLSAGDVYVKAKSNKLRFYFEFNRVETNIKDNAFLINI